MMANSHNFIGHYRIVDKQTSSVSSSIYLCEDTTHSDAIVAVKLMQTTHLGSQQEQENFLQEAQHLVQLQHPFIVPMLDVGIERGFPYTVMEYMSHGSLQERVKKLAPLLLSTGESLNILSQVGQALHYTHQQNIVHRALKPSNILFNVRDEALLSDFGNTTALVTGVKYGASAYAAYYMAPEQFRGTASKESDQYALGCIAYELFTGHPPFAASNPFTLGQMHMEEVPVSPLHLNSLVSPTIEQAILQALAKQPSERHQDIAAFLAALGIPPVKQPHSSIVANSDHYPGKNRRIRRLWLITMAFPMLQKWP